MGWQDDMNVAMGRSSDPNQDLYSASMGGYQPGNLLESIVFPALFTQWEFNRFPVAVTRSGAGQYDTTFDPKATPGIAAIFAGVAGGTTKIYYADRSKADNSGGGLTAATAKQGIRQAIAAGEADASATNIIVYVADGDYDRTADMLATGGGAVLPSKPTAVIGSGSGAINSPTILGLAWAADTGTSYKVVRSSTSRVINKTSLDARGNGRPYLKYATRTEYDAATGDAYFFDTAGASGPANTLYVKRADGAAVTETNTRVLLQADSCRVGTAPLYVANIKFLGGLMGTLQRNGAAVTVNVAAENCHFLYPGIDQGVASNCVTADFDGLLVLKNNTYGYSTNDAINPHAVQGKLHTLVIGGYSYSIGAKGAVAANGDGVSCNLLTSHENSPMIAIGNVGTDSAGGAWRFVGTSQACLFGCSLNNDRGDVAFGGSNTSTGALAEDTTRVWLYEPSITNVGIALRAGTGATLYYNDPVVLQGTIGGGGGTVTTFTR